MNNFILYVKFVIDEIGMFVFKEEVRRHFNCSTLEGAELENQGIEGTALTHWEKRIFEVCLNYVI